MAISVFDLFKIGIGPSSSHTVGPMIATRRFIQALALLPALPQVSRITIELFGSLGATGKGHGSDKAVLLGLLGEAPETVDVEKIPAMLETLRQQKKLDISTHSITFNEATDLTLHRKKQLPYHPNGIRCCALDSNGNPLSEKHYYSVGGGFIVDDEAASADESPIQKDTTALPYSFNSGDELLAQCKTHGLSISDLMLENEKTWRDEQTIRDELLNLWHVMETCINNGSSNEGILPGGLKVKRRAKALYESLIEEFKQYPNRQSSMDWVNLYALAVNEENAAGGRIVTAPTNGAAGIIPAVLSFYVKFRGGNEDSITRFLLTAGAIGILFKENASISGAEVGCQGEVGSACSMAAAGLTEVMGGIPEQVENAAEIGLEHNLGLTCDPIGGLVQVPCIERNAMGAVKAINASRMAMRGDGTHYVSLDKAIKTMRDTGKDMHERYKETARGGLAVNVLEVPVSQVDC